MLDKEEQEAVHGASEAVHELREKRDELSRTFARLTDLYITEDLEREEYLSRRKSVMSDKRTLEEQIGKLEQAPTLWVEPVRNWILDASRLGEIAKSEDCASKKLPLQKIFGLNLTLHAREARGMPLIHWRELHSAGANSGKIPMGLIFEPMPGFEPGTYSLPWSCSTS